MSITSEKGKIPSYPAKLSRKWRGMQEAEINDLGYRKMERRFCSRD
jgi:hypothetical protein